MLKDVGKYLQYLAVVNLVFDLIATLVGAIVIFASLANNAIGLAFLFALVELVGGAYIAVFTSLLTCGFGIVVESHENTLEEKKQAKFSSLFVSSAERNSRDVEAGEWKCPSCGKINQNYVGTCGCGTKKP